MVHGDFSPYNIMWHGNRPVVIDVSQAVVQSHPKSQEFLVRDVTRLVEWANKNGLDIELAEAIRCSRDGFVSCRHEARRRIGFTHGLKKGRLHAGLMRQTLPRVPKDRIAVLIGAKGATRRELEEAAGCKSLQIDSNTGEIDVTWPEAGGYDPVKALKLPDVIKAVGRGMAPSRAIQLLRDDWFFEMVDQGNMSESVQTNSEESVQESSARKVKFVR